MQNSPAVDPPAHAAFTENQASPLTLAPALVLTDPNAPVAPFAISATVAIVAGAFTGDILTASVGTTGILLNYDTTSERLTLTGSATDTLADFQGVLETVRFDTASDNPTDFGLDLTRNVVWTVDDGTASNNIGTATSTIDITAVNDPPTLATVATSAPFTENAGSVTLSNAVSVSDPDSLRLVSATVSIAAGTFAGDGDVLDATASGNITVSYNSTSEVLTLSGLDTLPDYQAVLDTVTFNSTSDNPDNFGADTSRQVTWVLNDGSGSSNLSAPATTTVNITAINDAPTIAAAASDLFVTGQTLTLSPSLSVSDPDNLNLASATVSVTAGILAGDVLAANTAGTGILAVYDTGAETLTLTGVDTLAHYRQVLDWVTFSSTAADPTDQGSDPTRTITWTANDGATDSAAATTTVSLQVGPAIFVPANAAFTEGNGPTTLDTSIALSDSNPGAAILSATVALTGGTFAGDGDVLDATALGNIGVAYNSTSEVLVLSGSDTVANYRAVLDSVTFTTASDNPDNFAADPTRTVVWTVVDDSLGTNTTGTATTSIAIAAVNDAPTLVNVAPSASYTENAATATTLSATSVTVSDPDSLSLAGATVAIASGTFAGDGDQLAASTGGTNITASYNATSETLTLTGSDTSATTSRCSIRSSSARPATTRPTSAPIRPAPSPGW